jgi:hypothetical protein
MSWRQQTAEASAQARLSIPPIGDTPMSSSPRGARLITRALITALEESAADANATNLRRILDSLIGKAIAGDLYAIREIL